MLAFANVGKQLSLHLPSRGNSDGVSFDVYRKGWNATQTVHRYCMVNPHEMVTERGSPRDAVEHDGSSFSERLASRTPKALPVIRDRAQRKQRRGLRSVQLGLLGINSWEKAFGTKSVLMKQRGDTSKAK